MTRADIRRRLLAMLDARACDASICPSEVARAMLPDGEWRSLMPEVRAVAQALADQGKLQATRGNEVVDPTSTGGPIRLRRPRKR